MQFLFLLLLCVIPALIYAYLYVADHPIADFADINAIRIGKGVDVVLVQEDVSSVKYGPGTNGVQFEIMARQLYITRKWPVGRGKVYITCNHLKLIHLGSSSTVICKEMTGEEIELIMEAGSRIDFKGNVQTLKVNNNNGSLSISENYALQNTPENKNGTFTAIYRSII